MINKNITSQLAQGIAELGLMVSSEQQDKLLAYLALLSEWNRVYNLTAIREPSEMVTRHVLDSLSLVPYLQGNYFLDVGSGAGIPGLILAIACPAQQWRLLDSNGKKTRFMQHAITALQLRNSQVQCQRVEQYSHTPCFDQITSRAYSDLISFYQQTQHLAHHHTQWLAMKGIYPDAELMALKKALNHDVMTEIIPLHIPFLNAQRHVVKLWREN
ncbi:16S rRNA (guanine(527)-N(7))-methyltransferase RsmG [Thioflexithrix psekupsensis]|uniref:Ribosomal RNA small subunit methyltransferase G n=1 Tax=Thioflexithrix psekupsensis TaxID=1570016 RepID=A0A251X8X8_9GAMM|nr:16S rRNA (guanine(527)-N(7))-methyltransferase RsmG [Thioflexithrix psekupsensis]OUD13982.1 16S rRNA (guanine(527)-N(7))-methyltransferase RsmG [Thioflexithrix psekupsensis]